MRILKLPLAGLLFCVMALFAGCKTSNEPKAPVALTWEMGASDIEPGYYENTFILKNISQKPLKKNWTIYYSQLPRGVKQEGASEVKVEVVNGNFFKMYPTDEFAPLAPGDSMRITFLCTYKLDRNSHVPEGTYWVETVDGKEGSPLPVALKALPLPSPESMSGYPDATKIYESNLRLAGAPALVQSDILPSVKKVVAIEGDNVQKIYKLYDKPSDRMKEAFGFGKKTKHKLHYALKGVDMKIYQGETVGIIGTNGSGKSTILKIITGVLNPTSGRVLVNGRISALLELGAGFNMEYNGIENVYLNGTMMGFSEKEIEAKLPEILSFADIGDYVYQPVKTYSSGMFVRLAFAVAINIEPEILIVDEALSVGDVFFQAKCYHKFEEFKKMGKTIVFVSHDLSSISKYCDRVYLLNQGNILGEGSPKAMIDTYKRVLVGQYDGPESVGEETASLLDDEDLQRAAAQKADEKGTDASQASMEAKGQNPNALEYGTKQAQIEEFYITDDRGVPTNAILKGSMFTIHMRVRFMDHIPAPIFAFSVKNVIGVEITGTNTMIEKAFLDSVEPGEVKNVTFTQKMNLQGGEYLLSLGVTGYNQDTFEVYHRLYDALNITVVSDKNTVGYYDMDSETKVWDAEEK